MGGGRYKPAGAEMEGAPLDDKDAKALPYASQAPTDSHTELAGHEAAHEVETPMSRPVEMQGEGYVGSQEATEREAGPHEMDGN
jgi:deferrochelatase/peroxidase EfeB